MGILITDVVLVDTMYFCIGKLVVIRSNCVQIHLTTGWDWFCLSVHPKCYDLKVFKCLVRMSCSIRSFISLSFFSEHLRVFPVSRRFLVIFRSFAVPPIPQEILLVLTTIFRFCSSILSLLSRLYNLEYLPVYLSEGNSFLISLLRIAEDDSRGDDLW